MSDEMIERVSRAISGAGIGYSIRLVSLVDGVHVYTLTHDDQKGSAEALTFPSHSEALDYVQEVIGRKKARAAAEALWGPTDEMKQAGLDGWLSGGSISDLPGAEACWNAMIWRLLGVC